MSQDVNTMVVMDLNGLVWKRNDTLNIIEFGDGTTRPYTPEEIVAANERAAIAKDKADLAALKQSIRDTIADVNANIDLVQPVLDATNASINASPAASIKIVARAIKRALQTERDLARLI
jgi:hypothetical protein